MTKRRLILILATTTALGALALAAAHARDVPKVATGFVANLLCSETFVSGFDPERVFAETMQAMPGTGLITWAMDYKVDRVRKDVAVTLLGLGRSHAVYREGLGCYVAHDDASVDASLPPASGVSQHALLPEIAGPAPVEPSDPELKLALDRADEPAGAGQAEQVIDPVQFAPCHQRVARKP